VRDNGSGIANTRSTTAVFPFAWLGVYVIVIVCAPIEAGLNLTICYAQVFAASATCLIKLTRKCRPSRDSGAMEVGD